MKVGDKVHLKAGKEKDPAHARLAGTVEDTREPTAREFGIRFEGAEQLEWYVEEDIVAPPAPEAPATVVVSADSQGDED